jgi:peptide/nickel transport system substrate-binding protein
MACGIEDGPMKSMRSALRCVCLSALISIVLLACQERGPSGVLKIGLAEEPRTLNVWLASDANSRKVLSLIYQPLYMFDPDTLALVPWLAETLPVYNPISLSYTIRLRSARWSDGSPFTSKDVAFTGELIQSFKVPRYASKWKFIDKVETPDERTVVFYLKKPMASFFSDTLATPIVQTEEWVRVADRREKKP